jgi:MFS family permease
MEPTMRLDNPKKLAIVTFFANLYFYNHISTLYLQTRGLNLLQVSSIWSLIVGTIFLAEAPTGILADRIGRKWSIVMALLLQTLGEVLFIFARSYPAFVLIAILAGIGYAFQSGASEALVYDSLPADDRDTAMKKAMGLIGGAYQLAFFAAPLIGGVIVSQLVLARFLTAILLTACSVAIALLVSLTLSEPQTGYRRSPENPLVILREGIREVKDSIRLRWLIAVAVLTSTFFKLLLDFYQPQFARAAVPAFWIGAAWSLGALLAFVLQRYAYWIEGKLGKIGFFALTAWPGLMYLILAAVSAPLLLVPVFVVAYASMEARNPLLSSYKNAQIKSKNRATVLSLVNMISSLYVALMGLVFGKIADYSISTAYASIGVLILVFAVILRTDRIAGRDVGSG